MKWFPFLILFFLLPFQEGKTQTLQSGNDCDTIILKEGKPIIGIVIKRGFSNISYKDCITSKEAKIKRIRVTAIKYADGRVFNNYEEPAEEVVDKPGNSCGQIITTSGSVIDVKIEEVSGRIVYFYYCDNDFLKQEIRLRKVHKIIRKDGRSKSYHALNRYAAIVPKKKNKNTSCDEIHLHSGEVFLCDIISEKMDFITLRECQKDTEKAFYLSRREIKAIHYGNGDSIGFRDMRRNKKEKK